MEMLIEKQSQIWQKDILTKRQKYYLAKCQSDRDGNADRWVTIYDSSDDETVHPEDQIPAIKDLENVVADGYYWQGNGVRNVGLV